MPPNSPPTKDLLRLPLRALAALATRAGLRIAALASDHDLSTLELSLEVPTGRPVRLRDLGFVPFAGRHPRAGEVRATMQQIGRTTDRALAKFTRNDDRLRRHAETAQACDLALRASIAVGGQQAVADRVRDAIAEDFRWLCVLCGGRASDDFPPIDVLDFQAWPLWPYGVPCDLSLPE
ncbi:MAG: hypothetical protein ACT4QC_07040 [Planctomycetaceae bacterium]